MKIYRLLILVLLSTVMLAGCSSLQEKAQAERQGSEVEHSITSDATVKQEKLEIYEVHQEGRIYVFYDRDLYIEFLLLGETPFRLTKIGAGPNGETVVFGITKEDKKKASEAISVKVYDGQVAASEDFYAEMIRHGRIYVFSNFEDMQPVRDFGHPNFFYSEIGAGPKGETVIYVLSSENKKKRPDALIAEYKSKL